MCAFVSSTSDTNAPYRGTSEWYISESLEQKSWRMWSGWVNCMLGMLGRIKLRAIRAIRSGVAGARLLTYRATTQGPRNQSDELIKYETDREWLCARFKLGATRQGNREPVRIVASAGWVN